MRKENLDSLLERFHRIVDEEIASLLRRGPTDLDAVCVAVEERASMLVAKLDPLLGARQRRIIVQRRLKHTRIEPDEALRLAAAEAAQPEFDFYDIEEFRGAPRSVTFKDTPTHVTYLHYLDTSIKTRLAAKEHLADSISADTKQYHALSASNDFADQMTRALGFDEDTPLRIVLEAWFKQRGKAGGA